MQFFDTSVLIAAFDAGDTEHERAWELYSRDEPASIAQHTLGETFSILTGRRGVRARAAYELIRTNTEGLKRIALTDDEYLACLAEAEGVGVRGGTIYDALILGCARKAKATVIWTFNVRHFQTFAPELRGRVKTPGENVG